MTKPFKLRIHLPSFQICRSITSSSLAKSPSTTRGFAPVNAKALDIIYPKSPPPPPSSPNHPSCKSKIASVGSESVEPELRTTCVINSTCNMESPAAYGLASTLQKLYNSPEYSAEFDQILWPNASSNAERNNRAGSNNWVKDQSATSVTTSFSSADSTGWSSSEDGDDNDNESEDQLSSCSSFDSSCDYDHSVKTPVDHKSAHGNESERKIKDGKVRRLKRYVSVSNSWKDGDKIKLATTSMLPAESDSSVKKTVLGRLLPCGLDGKVNESYAIMKKSADPFDDFKMSMLEMIMEKQISEPEDLEKLLMCFLSLNAKDHHAVIVAAFTEVWEELYDSGSQQPNSSG